MDYNEKNNSLYIRGVILASNTMDDQGDILSSSEIKKIFTTYANRNQQDLMHDFKKHDGIKQISNEIIKKEETLNNKTIPPGSWLCDCVITDQDIQEKILKNKIRGYSLGAISKNNTCLKKRENDDGLDTNFYFKDLKNLECLEPLFISLVDKPSNGFTLETYNYKTYLKKNSSDKMNENKIFDKIMNKLEKILEKIDKKEKRSDENDEDIMSTEKKSPTKKEKKAEKVEEVEEVKPEKEEVDEPSVSDDLSDLKDEIDKIKKDLKDFKKLFNSDEITIPLISKACELAKKYNQKLEEKEEEKEDNDEVDVRLEKKSEKLNTSNPTHENINNNNFFKKTKRDPYTGCKIR